MTILLTSATSRRKALLEQVGFQPTSDFVLAAIPLEYPYRRHGERLTLAQVRAMVVEAAGLQVRLAHERRALQERGLSPEDGVLVGAETVLFHDGRVLERPPAGDGREATPEEIKEAQAKARPLLQMLRGQEITVLTGLVVAQGDAPANQKEAWAESTIKMRLYSDRDIEAYLATGEGLAEAAGVDFHQRGVVLCEKIKGSFSNIGGLPLLPLLELLRDPLFAPRIRFRLSEPDQGRYSVPLKEGPLRSKRISPDDMAPRLLLASQSPRRRELLKQIVAPNRIEVLASRQAEPYLAEAPEVRVKRLALEKARSVLAREGAYSATIEIVIGADTEVVLDGQALGKPAGEEEARQQLGALQGRTHQVITGLALISVESGKEYLDSVTTRVKFKALSEEEIDTYIASGEPFGKAGAYGIQSKGALFVEEIDGSYSNVVGLPLERLSTILEREFDLTVWQLGAVSGRGWPRPEVRD